VLRERGCEWITTPRRDEYDLTDAKATASLFAACKPAIVIHLAAEVGGIGANMRRPGRFTYANLAMGLHVIEQCRLHSVERVVVVGTVCSYPESPPVPFREGDLWNGYPEPTNAGYGVAKRAVGELLRQYHAEYGLDGAVVIPTNLYGPDDNFDPDTSHVIPAMIRRFCDGGPVTLWGDGTATREFLHVDVPDPINLGGGGEVSMSALATMIAGECGYDGAADWDATKPNGQQRRAVDATRARERLGWSPRVSLEDGIRETVRWWRSHGAGNMTRRLLYLADLHGGTDLVGRVGNAMQAQDEQRKALREAAERIAELERALFERGE
jgi:GDP-L-fucose synthase